MIIYLPKKKLFNYKIEHKNQFLLGDKKIIMSSNKEGQNSILIGSLDNESNYKTLSFIKFNHFLNVTESKYNTCS